MTTTKAQPKDYEWSAVKFRTNVTTNLNEMAQENWKEVSIAYDYKTGEYKILYKRLKNDIRD